MIRVLPFAVVLAWWLAAKLYLLSRLHYGIDMAVSLAVSRTLFWDGRLLYDPNWGFHSAVHNSYTILFFAPLTLLFDAPGLFVGMIGVHAAVLVLLFRTPELSLPQKTFVAVCLVGPVSYFIFDDPLLGFHPDQLLVPLTLMLAMALVRGRRDWAAVCAVALFLTKETGAIALGSIWLLWRGISIWPGGRWSRETVRGLTGVVVRSVLLTLGAAAASALLLWLNQQWFGIRASAGFRLSEHLSDLARLAGTAAYWRGVSAPMVGMIACCLTVLLWNRRALRLAPLLVAAIAPLLVVTLVSDAGYYDRAQIETRSMAAYRMATVWGIALAALYFSMTRGCAATGQDAAARPRWSVSAHAAGVVAAQFLLVAAVTSVTPGARWLPWWFDDGPAPLTLSAEEQRAVDCLSSAVPRGAVTAADMFLAAPFDHAQLLFFEAFNRRHDPPVLVVCAPAQRLWRMSCDHRLEWARARSLWTSGDVGDIHYAAAPVVARRAAGCLPPAAP